MTTLPALQTGVEIMCLTCGFFPDPGRGPVVHNEDWYELGHTDSAHMPNWAIDSEEWELADVGTIQAGDELGTGEVVRTVTHADLTTIASWPGTEDGQTRVTTDHRTIKVGWPGQSQIVRHVRP